MPIFVFGIGAACVAYAVCCVIFGLGAAGPPTGLPQDIQNLVPAGIFAPQFAQNTSALLFVLSIFFSSVTEIKSTFNMISSTLLPDKARMEVPYVLLSLCPATE